MTGCALLVLIAIFHSPRYEDSSPVTPPALANGAGRKEPGDQGAPEQPKKSDRHSSSASPSAAAPTAEEIVAGKVSQFGNSRRDLVRAIARRAGKDVPSEVE